MRPDDPSLLTPSQRSAELAAIFAAGILRLRSRAPLPGGSSSPEMRPDLRMSAPREPKPASATPDGTRTATIAVATDDRLPPAGTILMREYKGRTLQVRVLEHGFEFRGRGLQVPECRGPDDHGPALHQLPLLQATPRRCPKTKSNHRDPIAAAKRLTCAVYTRKSTEDGNMDRPALRRLIAEIAVGKVQCVVAYKVDRLRAIRCSPHWLWT